jgi:replicative DNA helicase
LDKVAVSRSTKATPAVSAGESATRALDAIAQAYQLDGAITGISYGLPELDAKTSGLQRGELTILAGRPGMMKSGLALAVARRMSEAGHKGIFFSLEMKDIQLTRRIFSDIIFETKEVPYNRMRSGRVSEAEFTLIRDAARTLESWPLQIEQDDVSLSQIASRARQWKRRHGLDYLIVDHIGHVQSADRYRGNKNLELAEISGGLMRLARELDIGVLALCQLNRAVESRDNKRPTLADLRESGAIEQDAATVMFVYREAYYLQNQEPRPGTPEHGVWQEKMIACLNDLEIIIQKQRDGPVGSVQAYVNPGCNAVRPKGWYRDFSQPATEEFAF